MSEEYEWNIEDMVLPQSVQEQAKLSDYMKKRKTVVYYPDEELRVFPKNPHYYIGNYGTVYSTYNNKKLNIFYDKDGYEFVRTRDGNVRIHRAILETFNPIENSQEMQVNHIDGNKTNNVYDTLKNIINLEWCTGQQNIEHAIKNGLRPPGGENHHKAIYTEEEIWKICELLNDGLTGRQIAEKLNRKHTPHFQDLMTKIRTKESWAFISNNFPNIKVQHHKKKSE